MTSPDDLSRYAGVPATVVGATGFVGRWIARRLTAAGARIDLVVRRADPALFARYAIEGRVHELDVATPGQLESVIRIARPAVIFNAAGYGVDPGEKRAGDVESAKRLNSELPPRLALAASEATGQWTGRRIVQVGTVLEYGQIGGDLEERSRPRPIGLYATSKLAGTRGLASTCQTRGIDGVTARVAQLYGPGEHAGRLLPMLIAARGGAALDVLSVGTQRKDFTYVDDVAEGLLRLGLTSGVPGEVINLATGRLTTVRRFVEAAARQLGLPAERLQFSTPVSEHEIKHEPISIARLESVTGFRPSTSLERGIALTVAFAA